MYRVAFRSARSAALVRQSPCFFSSSPFDGTPPPPPPSPPPPPPPSKVDRPKKSKTSTIEGAGTLHVGDIVASLSLELDLPKDTCKSVVTAAFDYIGAAMAHRKPVTIIGFGSFHAKESKATTKIHPRTKEPMDVPAKWRPKFNASKTILTKWVETGVKPVVKSADKEGE